jgi:predicted nucleic acid-binding Zn ribbon protein
MRSQSAPPMVRTLLDQCLDRIAGEPGAAAIWRVWEGAVGAQIARRAQPIRLRGKTLLVAVSSAPWMQELQLLKRTILTELNARLATPLIGDLFFVLAATPDVTGEIPAGAPAPRRRCPPAPTSTDTSDLAALPEPLRACFDSLARAWRQRARS